ncbi:MAG: NUDIX domain-containing protein [Patescibacteria group bacterium]
MSEESLQCFDDNESPTEGRPRSEVKKEPERWWHGGSAIWVINNRGEILCSRRALHCPGNPGKWQTCFGGHLPVGISFAQNACKELAEELGVVCEESNFVFLRRVKDEKHKKIEEQFAIQLEIVPEECTFPDGEVTEVRWMTLEEARRQKELHPKQWTNGCPKETEAAIKNVIPKIKPTTPPQLPLSSKRN